MSDFIEFLCAIMKQPMFWLGVFFVILAIRAERRERAGEAKKGSEQ